MIDLKDKLRAWTLVDELVLEVYAITKSLGAESAQELPAMLRGAALRAALRVVQGVHGRGREFETALRLSQTSLAELRYYLYLARRLSLIDVRRYRAVCLKHDRVHKYVKELAGPLPGQDGAGSADASSFPGDAEPSDGPPFSTFMTVFRSPAGD